jgi:hypothetical protein
MFVFGRFDLVVDFPVTGFLLCSDFPVVNFGLRSLVLILAVSSGVSVQRKNHSFHSLDFTFFCLVGFYIHQVQCSARSPRSLALLIGFSC